MKGLLHLLVLLTSLVSAYPQGKVYFANRVPEAGIDAPVFFNGGPQGPGPDYTAQLFLVRGTSLTPVATSIFQSPGPGSQSMNDRYWNPITVEVPGVLPGQNQTFRVRAWKTSAGSYDASPPSGDRGRSESTDIVVLVGGGLLPPGNLVGLESFSLYTYPEPSSLVLGIVGSVLLFLCRRHRIAEGERK